MSRASLSLFLPQACRARAGVALALLLTAGAAQASSWVVCDYTVESLRIGGTPRELTVRVLQAQPGHDAECPAPSGEWTFTPETADYQSELPRARWPRPGQRALLRYRHLDGVCKSSGPCRIRHHSILRTL